MKLAWILFAAAVATPALFPGNAWGQVDHTLLRTASYALGATLDDRPGPGMTRKFVSGSDIAQSFTPSTPIVVSGSATNSLDAKGHADATLSGFSEVKFGSIKLRIDGHARVSTSSNENYEQGGSVKNMLASAFGDFRDIWRMSSASRPNRDLVVVSEVRIKGDWGVVVNGTQKYDDIFQINDGGVGIQIFINSNGIVDSVTPDVPNRIGVRNYRLGDSEPFSLPEQPIFESYPVRITKTIQEGVLSDYIVGMRVSASGFLETNAGSDSVSTFFYGNFDHTLNWGGITSVTDALTGEPVTDWTLQSESGFDYTRAVPEPSTLTIATVLLAVLAGRHSRRK